MEESPDTIINSHVYENLPESSTSLVDIYLIVTKNMHEKAEEFFSDNWEYTADTALTYSKGLQNTGNHTEALKYAQKSACLYQRNAPEFYLDHIQALVFLSRAYDRTGQLETAILILEETIDRYQQVHYDTSTDYAHDYIRALMGMSGYYNQLTQLGKAIKYGQQAYQKAQQFKGTQVAEIALKLSVMELLADCYQKADDLKQAEKLLEECVLHAKDLCSYAHDAYILTLISSLELLATVKARLGNQDKALVLVNEALNTMQKIYNERPQAFAQDYAGTLIALAGVHLLFDNPKEAGGYYNQAIGLLESTSKISEGSFALLNTALNNRLGVFLALNRLNEAIRDCYRLICLYRHRPGYIADLAFSFKGLATCRIYSGNMFKANRSIHVSINFYYDLVEKDEHFLADLCHALSTLSVIERNLGRFQDSIVTTDEIIEYLEFNEEYLKQANPTLFLSVMVTKIQCLTELERYHEGLDGINSAIEFSKRHHPRTHRLQAELLLMSSDILLFMGNNSEALENASESARHYRLLSDNQTPSARIDLANVLSSLCYLQSEIDPEAAMTINEVLAIYKTMPSPLTDEMLAGKTKAFGYQADLALILGLPLLAIQGIKSSIQNLEPLIKQIDKHTDYTTWQIIYTDMKEIRQLLQGLQEQVEWHTEYEQLNPVLVKLESSFQDKWERYVE